MLERSISFDEFIIILKKRIKLIISMFIFCVGITSGISFFILPKVYDAQAQILVNQKNINPETFSWSQMETDLTLIDTYNVIIKSPAILKKVIGELNIKLSSQELSKKITVSHEENSKVVNINVEDENLHQAVSIANTVAEVFKEEIPLLMSVDNINILAIAEYSSTTKPVKPKIMLNIGIATIVGLILGIGLALLRESFDRTIMDEYDIEEITNLPLVGFINQVKSDKK